MLAGELVQDLAAPAVEDVDLSRSLAAARVGRRGDREVGVAVAVEVGERAFKMVANRIAVAVKLDGRADALLLHRVVEQIDVAVGIGVEQRPIPFDEARNQRLVA